MPEPWKYGDDSTWYQGDNGTEGWQSMTTKEARLYPPQAAAQKAANDKKKVAISVWSGGRWGRAVDLDVLVMLPESSPSVYAMHLPTYRMFRSVGPGSDALTSTALGRIVGSERDWLSAFLRTGPADVIGRARRILDIERGLQEALREKEEAIRSYDLLLAAQEKDGAAQEEALTTPPRQPVAGSLEAPNPTLDMRSRAMALLDVKTETRTIRLIEKRNKIVLDRNQLIGILRSQGAEVPREAAISLVSGMVATRPGDVVKTPLDQTDALTIEWTTNEEKEEKS